MSQFDWPIIQKMKLWNLPKIEGFILKYNVHPVGPTYIGERMTTFAKAYAIKVRGYGENVGQHIGNLRNIWRMFPLGTWRELSENTFGNQGKMKKNPPTPQLEKARHVGCMLGPSHWLHEISLSKRVCHHFWPELIPLAKNNLPPL